MNTASGTAYLQQSGRRGEVSEDGEYTILKRQYIERGCRIAELKHDIDQYREIDKDMLKRIEVLEYEVAMWRKHVPELEADLAKAKLSNKGMHKTIERLTDTIMQVTVVRDELATQTLNGHAVKMLDKALGEAK